MNSKEIALLDGSKYLIYAVNAEVITDPQRWSETHVHSSGGGGFVHPTQGGHVSAPQVSSTVIDRQSYIVKTERGREIELKDAVTARKGHSIRIIYGGIENDEPRIVATENNTMSKYVLEKPRYFGKYFTIIGALKSYFKGKYKFITVPISLVAIIIIDPRSLFVIPLLPFFGFIWATIELRKRAKLVDKELISFINNLN